MKSLVLKDLFNIGHNAKSMLFILVVFAVALIPFSGVEGYIFVCAILCSMMIVTTFSFDDSSKWTRYAMIMPVSKKELVAGKFMVLAIFCAIGSLFGLIIGFIGGLITDKIVLDIVGIGDADGKISLNQQKPSKHAGLRRFGPEKFLQRNNEFMKERPIFYKKPIKTEKDFSTWLRCFYYTTKAVITEYIYF